MRFFALVLVCACGAGEAHVAPVLGNLPSLRGRPVYSTALADAPEDVSRVWPSVESALNEEPQHLEEWSRERMQLIQSLDPQWGRLAHEGSDERLFAAVTRALLYDDLATKLSSGARATEAAEEARRAYASCVREAPGASEFLQDWSSTCLERSNALDSLLH